MILFLDDDSNRAATAYQRMLPSKRDKTIWCTTAQEAISVLDDAYYRDRLEEVHLDHDLGGEQFQDPNDKNCGMEVIRFIESLNSSDLQHIKFTIHTWNGAAGVEMRERLTKLGLKVVYSPFGTGRL